MARVRPRLLFLCQTLPYPPDGGVWIRTYHILRLLARAFDITALCFERSGATGGPSIEEGRTGLARFGGVEVFDLPQQHSRVRFLWDHLRSAASGRVYTTFRYDSRRFRRRLAELLRSERFDLVHLDSLDLARFLPACAHLPTVCVHHDVESDLLKRKAGIQPSRWRAAYLRHQSRLMEKVERRWCERITVNVAVSEHDRARLGELAPAARVAVVPNGVDVDEFLPDDTATTGVAFVGGTSPAPNGDALTFFCDQILPHLRAAAGPVPVRWIGRASADEQQFYRARHGVELTGYIDDVRPLMREAACHIVPLRAGGGTRLKVLNSWAMGKAVVSTRLGCEGLAAIDSENVLVRDHPRDFADAIVRVLRDSLLRRRLGEHGRAAAERIYSWDVIGRSMIDLYLATADAHSSAARAAGLATGEAAADARY